MNLEILISKIINNLAPDIISKSFTYDYNNPTKGFCYVASECLYHLWGKQHGYFSCVARDVDDHNHWWLENKEGNILDITAEQYFLEDKKPPYDKKHKIPFLTKEPSKRCKKLLKRIGYEKTISM